MIKYKHKIGSIVAKYEMEKGCYYRYNSGKIAIDDNYRRKLLLTTVLLVTSSFGYKWHSPVVSTVTGPTSITSYLYGDAKYKRVRKPHNSMLTFKTKIMTKHKIGEIVDGNKLQKGLYYKYYSGDAGYSVESVLNAVINRILYVINNYGEDSRYLPECYITDVTDLEFDWMENHTYVFRSETKFERVRKPKIINNPNIVSP